MAYIGKQPLIGNFQVCDAISTVNGQAAYTLQVGGANVSPETANNMIVSVNGVIQKPNISYTVSGSTITFTSNLVTGDVIDFIQILGNVLDLGVPSDNTVTTAKIADGAVTSAKLSAGKVLQVVSTTKTDTFSSSSTSYADVTGISVAITPSSTNNKILVLVNFNASVTATDNWHAYQILRGATAINNGDAASSRTVASVGTALLTATGSGNVIDNFSINYLDSPSTTSATTYKLQGKVQSGQSFVINRSDSDGDASYGLRTASTITVMEIAG